MDKNLKELFKSVVFVSRKKHSFFAPFIKAICEYGETESSFIFSPSSMKDLNEGLCSVVSDRNATCLFVCGEYVINLDLLRDLSDLFLIRLGGDDDIFFDVYTKDISRYFDVNLTTSHECHMEMLNMGINSILVPSMYESTDEPKESYSRYDVSFCGAVDTKHGRKQYIDALIDSGIDVHLWGRGTSGGYIYRKDMLRLFAESKINLNFSGLDSNKSNICKITGKSLENKKQLKGRVFEVLHQGGFLIAEYVSDINCFFKPGVDLVTFKTPEELVSLVRFYLNNDEEREKIRKNGLETVKQYRYDAYGPELVKKISTFKKNTNPNNSVGPQCSTYLAQAMANGERPSISNFFTAASCGSSVWYVFYCLRKPFVKSFRKLITLFYAYTLPPAKWRRVVRAIWVR